MFVWSIVPLHDIEHSNLMKVKAGDVSKNYRPFMGYRVFESCES